MSETIIDRIGDKFATGYGKFGQVTITMNDFNEILEYIIEREQKHNDEMLKLSNSILAKAGNND